MRPQELVLRFPLVNGHPDVAGLLRDGEVLASIGPMLAEPFLDSGVTKVLAPEARGPILGALVAVELGAGLVLARKVGQNHPGADDRVTTGPTWRGDPQSFQLRSFDLVPTDRVLGVDDWITTGESAGALRHWVAGRGAEWVGMTAIVDKCDPEVTAALGAHTLVSFGALMDQVGR